MDTEPDIFFIVPYRDREAHLEIFINHMKIILDGINYMILISHQCDARLFNRGGLKNLGFLWIKKKYPNTYKEKTIVFHDVDNVYYRKNILNWKTTHGKIKHFFGVGQKHSKSLGGILSVTGSDFEKMNGFPNYWSWGYEDNAMYLFQYPIGMLSQQRFHHPSRPQPQSHNRPRRPTYRRRLRRLYLNQRPR